MVVAQSSASESDVSHQSAWPKVSYSHPQWMPPWFSNFPIDPHRQFYLSLIYYLCQMKYSLWSENVKWQELTWLFRKAIHITPFFQSLLRVSLKNYWSQCLYETNNALFRHASLLQIKILLSSWPHQSLLNYLKASTRSLASLVTGVVPLIPSFGRFQVFLCSDFDSQRDALAPIAVASRPTLC